MASSLRFHHTSQAEAELYFSQIEAKFEGLSGTTAIQRRKQIDAIIGLSKLFFLLCSSNLLSLLDILIPLLEFILGFKTEAIMTKQST